MALAFAKADYKVLVIDADLRKGVQHDKFRVEQKPGFIDAIKRVKNIEDLKKCMFKLKDFHKQNLYVEHEFDIFNEIDFYENLWEGKKSIYRDSR